MVVLPRISSTTTSRAFLSAAAAAMMPARSVEVIRFALCIVRILAVHPFRGDERGDHVGDQTVERLAPSASPADGGRADVRLVAREQRGSRGGKAEAVDLRRIERRRTGPVDDHESFAAEQVVGPVPAMDRPGGVGAAED